MKEVVHYRKGTTTTIKKFSGKRYYETHAACGVFSQVPHKDQGMKHTNNVDEVTCKKCLATLVIFDLTTPKAKEEAPAEEPVEFFDSEDESDEWN